ncbi:hypothetical protein NMG60_11030252 [Bertholletia excelsa]
MADADSYTKPQKFSSTAPTELEKPSKFDTHFMYKALFASVFLVLLPLLPLEAPEFINQTRSWELFQLIFVGIAISYGLFSRRNDETEKENNSRLDNAHSFVSGFLQVSSVFDDESGISPPGYEENKARAWNIQRYREEPETVITQKSSVLQEKPLLLPVRSLKSRVAEPNINGEASRPSRGLGSKRLSSSSGKLRTGEFFASVPVDMEETVDESKVLRSPIPWRSRSMERKEEIESVPMYCLPPSVDESELNRVETGNSRTRASRSSRSNSISPSPSFSRELQAKNVEDIGRNKIYNKSSAPPAPPPPPPPPAYARFSSPARSNSIPSEAKTSPAKELKRSVRSVPKELTKNNREEGHRRRSSEGDSRRRIAGNPLAVKSVRTTRGVEIVKAREIDEDIMNSNKVRGSKKPPLAPKMPTFDDYYDAEKPAIVEKQVVEAGEEKGSTDDEAGPDVNKRADEFIAKFREQIRLQRIESIKRSTEHLARNSST